MVINNTTSNLSYSDDNNKLDFGSAYDVRIAARNWLGYGEYSDAVRFTVGETSIHEISTCEQLQAMDTDPGTYKDTFILTKNIDCSGIPSFRALGNGGWNSSFRGVFDGQGYTISNLTINLPAEGNVGLFKDTDRAVIKDVTLHTGSVTGVYSVGAVVGYAYHTTISNVHSDLTVNGVYNGDWGWGGTDVGGLVGYMESDGATIHNTSISNSSSAGEINGTNKVGGLVGRLYSYPDTSNTTVSVSVTNNTFTGNVIGDTSFDGSSVGGLIGYINLDSESDDHTTSSVTVAGNIVTSANINGYYYVGGLIGNIDSYIDYDYDTNNITIADNILDVTVHSTDEYAAGLVGYIQNDMYGENSITQSTIEGNSISGSINAGTQYAGGLVGYQSVNAYGDPSSTYLTVVDNRSLASVGSQGYSGGLYGYIQNNNNNSGTFVDVMSRNYATGSVSANGGYVGGLIGASYIESHSLDISDSYFSGTLSSTGGVGGLIGVSSPNSGGIVNISRSYAVGTVAAFASGGDAGGLIGKNDEGTLRIDHSFAANSMNADHTKGSIVGTNNSGNGATLYLDEVYYDHAINSLGCVDDQAVGGCAPINTFEDPDPAYFINNSTSQVFVGEGGWDFDSIWTTAVASYPLLRTIFEPQDLTPPVLSTVRAITSPTTVTNAVYHFTSSEICTVDAQPVYSSLPGLVSLHISSLSDSDEAETAYLEGVQVGGTYSFAFKCQDANGNTSNTINSGLFTIAAESTGGGQSSGSYLRVTEKAKEFGTQVGTGFTRTLKVGTKGSDVKLLQQLLNKKGFVIIKKGAGSPGNESTVFGQKTKLAVIRFQKQNKLKADGVVGSKTWALISK